MRSFVLVLMIVLLPIRVWAAEGMAVRMAAQPAAMGAVAMDGMDAMADMPEDCPMRAAAQQQEPAEPQGGSHAACLTCTLCAAVAVPPDFRIGGDSPVALLACPMSSRFDSADPLPALKPPIS